MEHKAESWTKGYNILPHVASAELELPLGNQWLSSLDCIYCIQNQKNVAMLAVFVTRWEKQEYQRKYGEKF